MVPEFLHFPELDQHMVKRNDNVWRGSLEAKATDVLRMISIGLGLRKIFDQKKIERPKCLLKTY